MILKLRKTEIQTGFLGKGFKWIQTVLKGKAICVFFCSEHTAWHLQRTANQRLEAMWGHGVFAHPDVVAT